MRILGFSIFVVLMAGTSPARADDWSAVMHDPQNTNASTSTLDPTSLVKKWSSPSGYRNPLIVGNSIYAIDATNTFNQNTATISAFDISTGAVKWSTPVTGIWSPALAYGGGYLVYTGNNQIFVLDAATGAFKYSAPVLADIGDVVTVAQDTTTSQPVAYVSDGRGTLTAERLGTAGATRVWAVTGIAAGDAAPSVAGNLLLTADVDYRYAIDRTTGVVTPFKSGPSSGGSGQTIAVDLTHNRFYYGRLGTLTAYGISNNAVTQLWEVQAHVSGGVSVAPDGTIYGADNGTLARMDPSDGHIITSVGGAFSNANVPILSNGYVWEFGPGLISIETNIYRIDDLSLVKTIPGVFGYPGTIISGKSAVDDTHFIFDYGNSSSNPGFIVFEGTAVIPEPQLFGLVTLLVARRRTRK